MLGSTHAECVNYLPNRVSSECSHRQIHSSVAIKLDMHRTICYMLMDMIGQKFFFSCSSVLSHKKYTTYTFNLQIETSTVRDKIR